MPIRSGPNKKATGSQSNETLSTMNETLSPEVSNPQRTPQSRPAVQNTNASRSRPDSRPNIYGSIAVSRLRCILLTKKDYTTVFPHMLRLSLTAGDAKTLEASCGIASRLTWSGIQPSTWEHSRSAGTLYKVKIMYKIKVYLNVRGECAVHG